MNYANSPKVATDNFAFPAQPIRPLPEFNVRASLEEIEKYINEANDQAYRALVTIRGDENTTDSTAPMPPLGGIECLLYRFTENLQTLNDKLRQINDHLGIE